MLVRAAHIFCTKFLLATIHDVAGHFVATIHYVAWWFWQRTLSHMIVRVHNNIVQFVLMRCGNTYPLRVFHQIGIFLVVTAPSWSLHVSRLHMRHKIQVTNFSNAHSPKSGILCRQNQCFSLHDVVNLPHKKKL